MRCSSICTSSVNVFIPEVSPSAEVRLYVAEARSASPDRERAAAPYCHSARPTHSHRFLPSYVSLKMNTMWKKILGQTYFPGFMMAPLHPVRSCLNSSAYQDILVNAMLLNPIQHLLVWTGTETVSQAHISAWRHKRSTEEWAQIPTETLQNLGESLAKSGSWYS